LRVRKKPFIAISQNVSGSLTGIGIYYRPRADVSGKKRLSMTQELCVDTHHKVGTSSLSTPPTCSVSWRISWHPLAYPTCGLELWRQQPIGAG